MAEPGIGPRLRLARERLGWSREALAYHSGVSWSAIAQIESGRRKDARLTSLAALSGALGVSVDYLAVGCATAPPKLLGHQAAVYTSDEEFLSGLVPFLTKGMEESEGLLVVTAPPRNQLLKDALGSAATQVEFAASSDWYRTPRVALDRYGDFVREKLEAGAPWIRVVGEPVWTGLSGPEIDMWIRYESILNLVFASSPVTFVCPYDAGSMASRIIAGAHLTHPEITRDGHTAASPDYAEPGDLLIGVGSG